MSADVRTVRVAIRDRIDEMRELRDDNLTSPRMRMRCQEWIETLNLAKNQASLNDLEEFIRINLVSIVKASGETEDLTLLHRYSSRAEALNWVRDAIAMRDGWGRGRN